MKKQIPFLKYQLFFGLVSLIVVAGSIFLLATKGLNLDTDFTGGRKLLFQFNEVVTEAQLRKALDAAGLQDATVQHYGHEGEERFTIKAGLLPPEAEGKTDPIVVALQENFGTDKVVLQQEDAVGPKAGKELRRKAQVAVLVSCILILIYIGFRFDFMFAPGAIVALIHDILITMGAIALTGRSFSLTSVAALLTILGYSINDTIILYDRVREDAGIHGHDADTDIVNEAINQVFSRTLITSLTVLFVVAVLFVIADGAIQDFAFAMIVGVVAGTYSSIFVASPVYLLMKRLWPKLTPLFSGKTA